MMSYIDGGKLEKIGWGFVYVSSKEHNSPANTHVLRTYTLTPDRGSELRQVQRRLGRPKVHPQRLGRVHMRAERGGA